MRPPLCPILLLALIAVAGVQRALAGPAAAPTPEHLEFFERRIRPVLVERCYSCHSADAEKLKGGLHLDTRAGLLAGGDGGAVIVPGDASRSRLIEAIQHTNPDLKMPPKRKLTEAQIADFVTWVNLGAPDPRDVNLQSSKPQISSQPHWAFAVPREPELPEVKAAGWPKTPVDRFILAKLEAAGLGPAPAADKRTLIRRATFDLIGLPPTSEEVEAFLADPAPDAWAHVVERLLASPHYGERWGRYWLDVARYADTKGYVYSDREETRFIHSAAYRDWVVRALNEDLPYDRFLILQLAADSVGDPAEANSPAGVGLASADHAALGFLTLGRRFLGVVHDIIDDRIDVVMRGTQALTVSCARCHDHKFDPIPTRDYYSLYGVFAGSTETLVALGDGRHGASSGGETNEFTRGLRERVTKYQELMRQKREEFSNRFRTKSAEYLVAVLDVKSLPSEEFYEIRGADDLNPTVVRAWESYLRSAEAATHHAFAPWFALAALPAAEFTNRAPVVLARFQAASSAPTTNPRLLAALNAAPLLSMRDVARRYGEVFAETHQRWQALVQAATTNKTDLPRALPDAAEEELRQVIYGPRAPVRVPELAAADLEWYFDEAARVTLMKTSAEIERWILKFPDAAPHAVVPADRPVQNNPRVFLRGNPATKGEEVPRQFLAVLSGSDRRPFQHGSGRLELARAIASRDNPLTARVLVNRVWQHHFGAGLVRTSSDFGLRCEPPSHPELLDWLAVRFMNDGWSLKKLHRLIMRSAAYTTSSDVATATDRKAESVDPENKLLARFPRQRLDYEALRDSLLAVTGELDFTLGGPPVEQFKPPFNTRRSIYGFIDRQFLPGLLRVFDFANPDMHSPQRSGTTVPQQALFLINSPFLTERSRALTRRVKRSGATGAKAYIESFYRVVFQRAPTVEQLEAGLRFLGWAESLPPPEPPRPVAPVWLYGFGEFDPSAKRMKSFTALPHFTGEAWQGGAKWPDEKLGWVRLTADGGHAGNDLEHAAVRRWVAPFDATVTVSGTVKHAHKEGDGIAVRMVSSRRGLLGEWPLHNDRAETKAESLEVRRGDTLDFVVDRRGGLNNDDFTWSLLIRVAKFSSTAATIGADAASEWNAKGDFSGPPDPWPVPLDPWEKYAQVLLLSNEFVFVD